MNVISGGVCAAQGFRAAGIHCGVKASSKPDKNDVALILSDAECTASGAYTLNRVKAAPLYVTMNHLENGVAWGIVANSGNANACCPLSHENAEAMCQAAAQVTGHAAEDFVVASTGVIGQTINVSVIEAGMPALAELYQGEIVPSKAFIEGGIHEAIAEYENNVFFDILAEDLARRDMNDAPIDESNLAELTSRMEVYISEFEKNGTDNVTVDMEN